MQDKFYFRPNGCQLKWQRKQKHQVPDNAKRYTQIHKHLIKLIMYKLVSRCNSTNTHCKKEIGILQTNSQTLEWISFYHVTPGGILYTYALYRLLVLLHFSYNIIQCYKILTIVQILTFVYFQHQRCSMFTIYSFKTWRTFTTFARQGLVF